MKRLACVVVLTMGLFGIPSVASADPFDAKLLKTGLGAGVTVYSGASTLSVFAGQLIWDAQAGIDDFISYCVQMDSWVQPEQSFDFSTPGHISDDEKGKIAFLVSNFFSAANTNWMAAGLQLAIWNVLYDNDLSASTGTFRSTTSQATDWANHYLGSLKGIDNPTGLAIFLNSLPGATGQDQVTQYSTPEPGTLLLLGAGAALAARRRMARRAS